MFFLILHVDRCACVNTFKKKVVFLVNSLLIEFLKTTFMESFKKASNYFQVEEVCSFLIYWKQDQQLPNTASQLHRFGKNCVCSSVKI